MRYVITSNRGLKDYKIMKMNKDNIPVHLTEEECAELIDRKTLSPIEKETLSKFEPPIYFDSTSGYIFDKENQMLAEIRGWGHLGRFPKGQLMQDALGNLLVKLLNETYTNIKEETYASSGSDKRTAVGG